MKTFETITRASSPHTPLAWVCICFCIGIIINEYLKMTFAVFFSITALFMILGLFIRQARASHILLLLAIIFLGAVYAKNYQTLPSRHISHISYHSRQEPLVVQGVVVSDVEPRPFLKGKKTVFILEVKKIKTQRGWREKNGMVLVNLFRGEDIRYGDYLLVQGKLHRPFDSSNDGDFSYRNYLERKGITFILSVKKTASAAVLKRGQGYFLKSLSLQFKHRLGGILKKNLPKKQAGLMQAFLLGDRYDIPPDIYDLFKISGVAHIIAISGFNIGIVAYVLFLVLKMLPIPRLGQYILAMLLLIFYAFLTGSQPPVVRATIMAVIFLSSFLLEREPEPVNTLATAALILLMMNPLNLFDVGFQLSFISVFFIILFYPRFMDLFYKLCPGLKSDSKGRSISGERSRTIKFKMILFFGQSAAVSLAAYLGVVALAAYYFRLITPVVIIANLVVVPLASLIIFLGMGLLAVGGIFPLAGVMFAHCISVLLNLMVASVFLFVQIPGAYFELKRCPVSAVVFYYGLLLGLLFFWGPFSRKTFIPSMMRKNVNR